MTKPRYSRRCRLLCGYRGCPNEGRLYEPFYCLPREHAGIMAIPPRDQRERLPAAGRESSVDDGREASPAPETINTGSDHP
jgi:hypothetical protein